MEYPLVIETGETFLTHRTLLRFIREKCGDAVAEYLSGFLGEDSVSLKNAELLKKVKGFIDNLAADFAEADADLANAVSLLEKAGIE